MAMQTGDSDKREVGMRIRPFLTENQVSNERELSAPTAAAYERFNPALLT